MPLQTNKICITNLPASTLYRDIQRIFKKFGTIVRVYIVCEDGTKTCSGRAYIAYKTHEEANMAKDAMNNKEFSGTTICVAIASEEEYSLEVRYAQAPSVSHVDRSTQERSVTVTNEDKQREAFQPVAGEPRGSSKKAQFSKSWKPRGPQGFPGMRPPRFVDTPHTSPHRMDQSVYQQQQQRHGILGPPRGPFQSHSFPPGQQPREPFQHQQHQARLPLHRSPPPPSDIFNPQRQHSGHRPREPILQPPGPWPRPPAGHPDQTANVNLLHPDKSPNPNPISPGDRPPPHLPGQSGLPSFLHHQSPSSDNTYSAPARSPFQEAPQKPSISNVIAGLLNQINPNRASSTLGAHQQTPTFPDPAQRVQPPVGVPAQRPDRAPFTPGTYQEPSTFHGPAQEVQPPFGVPAQRPDRAPGTPGTYQQPPTFHGPAQSIQQPFCVPTQRPDMAPSTFHGPALGIQPPFGVPTQHPDSAPRTPGTYQQPQTFHGPAQEVQPPSCVPAKPPAIDLVSLLASGGILLRNSSDVNNFPGTGPSLPQLQNLPPTARPTYTQAAVPQHLASYDDSRQAAYSDTRNTETTTAGTSRNELDAQIPHNMIERNYSEGEHASPAKPLQSPQASTAKPSKITGYEVIKQVVREYIIDDKGNKIVREYERQLEQPPLRVPAGGEWSGHSAASKPEWRPVKETEDWGSVLDNESTDCGEPARPDYQDADSTTELKHSKGAQSSSIHKTKDKVEGGTRGRSRSKSRTGSQSRSPSRSRNRSRSKARSKRKRYRSTRSSSSDSSREGSRHRHASRNKLPIVWIIGDSYVLRAVERAQGSSLELDDIVDLHWKVLSEKQMLKNFKTMMDTLLDVSSERPSMIIVHLGAYDFAEDPMDNFLGILKYMAFVVNTKLKCRLVWSEMFPQLDRTGQQVYPQKHHFINNKARDIIQELGEGNHFISYPRIHPSPKLVERDCLELTQKGTDYFIRTLRRAIRAFMKKPNVLLYSKA